MKSLHVVCAVLLNAEGKVLICQRPSSKQQAGLWEFPGGKVDAGESESQALVRELQEELDCTVSVGERLTPVQHAYPDFSVNLVPFLCKLSAGEPKALEHEQIRWVAIDQLSDYQLSAADVPIVNELRARVSIL